MLLGLVFFFYLFGHAMPLLMAHTHVHMLFVEELALLGNQKYVTHKLTDCNNKSHKWAVSHTCNLLRTKNTGSPVNARQQTDWVK